MTARHRFAQPPVWNDDVLQEHRRRAIMAFIIERTSEDKTPYRAVFAEHLAQVQTLFALTNDLLDFHHGTVLAEHPDLIQVARYLSGPPISADDLDTLGEAKIATRKRLDLDLARKATQVIEATIEQDRFPWLFDLPRRTPTQSEREMAIRWTAGLRTVQKVQTSRRTESAARQQAAVEKLLLELGFSLVPRRPIDVTGGLESGQFSREALVVGTKCDVPICLRDKRFLFVECKVSNSETNSVKRLNRECGGKSGQWRAAFGERAITAAVLAGVFKLKNLKDAQSRDGVALFWEHDLGKLAAFLKAAV